MLMLFFTMHSTSNCAELVAIWMCKNIAERAKAYGEPYEVSRLKRKPDWATHSRRGQLASSCCAECLSRDAKKSAKAELQDGSPVDYTGGLG